MRTHVPPPNMRRRVVVLFPSGLTLLNLFFGVFAIVAASRELYMEAGWYVILGGMADAFDGRVARATNSEGRFGEELDSLVDVVTFGLAPAMIMYFAVMNRAGWDWLWCFAFTACAVLRLARFNVEQAGTSKTYFHGLPSPAAGITLATYYWFSQSPLYTDTAIGEWSWHQMLRIVMAVLAFLMVSNVPYPVMPPVGVRSPRQLIGLGILVCGTAMLIFGRLEYFFPLAVGYVAFGLLRGVVLGLLERQQIPVPAGWFPGGDESSLPQDGRILNSVGDGLSEEESEGRYFRPQRRRSGKSERGERGERGGSGPNNPS